MKILICNVGSTSLKYQLFDMSDNQRVIASGKAERVGKHDSLFVHSYNGVSDSKPQNLALLTHKDAICHMLDKLLGTVVSKLDEICCVAFKVVHAKGVTGVKYLDESVLKAMADYNSIAPAHNPPYISAIRQFAQLLPNVPLVGSFETGFHSQMPPEAYLYSIPIELSTKHQIRRYGFHGASHEYICEYVSSITKRNDLKLVSCHLGGSGSLCAIKDKKSIDTSLGFSLQCGIMHNNRIGDIDPYIIFYMAEQLGLSLAQIKEILQTKSGFYGMSGGISNDLRDIEKAAAKGNNNAQNAVLSYCYQIKKLIGSYAAAMGGLDAIAFAGGIGENSMAVREKVCENLDFLGVRLDLDLNALSKINSDISQKGSPVRIFIVGTNEEIIVAKKAMALLKSTSGEG